MAQIEIDNKTVEIDDKTKQVIKNDVSKDTITEYLNKFWTEKKLGKHSDMIEKHEQIVMKNLKIDAETFFKDLSKTTFKPGNVGPYNLYSILNKTSLEDDLHPEYIEDCLNVTTTRPAIGKGEFLFAASFANIGFAKDNGDLIDIKTGKSIECKGVNSVIGNGHSGQYKTMTKSLIYAITKMLDANDLSATYLNADFANEIKKRIGTNEKLMKKFFLITQNLENENEGIANACVKVYLEKKYLLKTMAAAHLYIYMNLEKADYLLAINGKKFQMFEKPTSVAAAYEIIEKFDISGWKEGDCGVKVTLK